MRPRWAARERKAPAARASSEAIAERPALFQNKSDSEAKTPLCGVFSDTCTAKDFAKQNVWVYKEAKRAFNAKQQGSGVPTGNLWLP